jgi:hypothetical protein
MMSPSLPELIASTLVAMPICSSHSETKFAASTEVCSLVRV